ncbi:MAG: VOC family protein [Polyangiaceae bacterium]|mgnify:CR=1 FL=1
MKLNHLDLQVSDVSQTARLFEELLGFRCTSNPESAALVFMTDGAGFTLVLQRKKSDAAYPEDFHFGCLVEDPTEVERFQAAVRAKGFEVSDVIRNNRGVLCYWRSPDGFLVEVSHHL